jgi:hypothetical protein
MYNSIAKSIKQDCLSRKPTIEISAKFCDVQSIEGNTKR